MPDMVGKVSRLGKAQRAQRSVMLGTLRFAQPTKMNL